MSIFGKWKGRTLSGFDAQKISRNLLPYSVLLAALFAMTFFGVCLPNTGPRGPKGSAAYVMGEAIDYREFRRNYENISRQKELPEDTSRLAPQVLEALIHKRVLSLLAQSIGVQASEQHVIESIQDTEFFRNPKTNAFDTERLRTYLENAEYTESAFFEEQRRDLTIHTLQQFITAAQYLSRGSGRMRNELYKTTLELEYLRWDPATLKLEITATQISDFLSSEAGKAEVQELYDLRQSEYQRQEKRRARQILIAFSGARNALGVTRSSQEAKQLAQDLHRRLTTQKASFAALARRYSDDATSKEQGGQMDFLTASDLLPELSQELFALTPGALSQVIASPFGFHLVELQEIKTALNLSIEEVQEELARELIIKKQQTLEAQKLAYQALQTMLPASMQPPSAQAEQQNHNSEHTWSQPVSFSPAQNEIPKIGSSSEIVTAALGRLLDNSEKEFPLVLLSPFLVDEVWYVVRIRSFDPPSLSAASEKAPKPQDEDQIGALIRQYQENQQGQQFMREIFTNYLNQLDQGQHIQRNPDYLKIGSTSSS